MILREEKTNEVHLRIVLFIWRSFIVFQALFWSLQTQQNHPTYPWEYLRLMVNWKATKSFRLTFWVVVSNIFYFHPYLGKIPNLTNIFQMGWFKPPTSFFLVQLRVPLLESFPHVFFLLGWFFHKFPSSNFSFLGQFARCRQYVPPIVHYSDAESDIMTWTKFERMYIFKSYWKLGRFPGHVDFLEGMDCKVGASTSFVINGGYELWVGPTSPKRWPNL